MFQHFKKSVLILVIIFCVIGVIFANQNIENKHRNSLKIKANERIVLYQNSLGNELTRFSFLPFMIARDKVLLTQALSQPELANLALEDVRNASKAAEIYIMNHEGLTLASSNWRSQVSFVGRNYGYRPYFKQALLGQQGQFYGIGATSKKPGYFISSGTTVQKNKTLVTVAKVDLSHLEKIWNDGGENVFITNRNGVVILSSNNQWRYKTLSSLSALQLKAIDAQKQFADEPLGLLADFEQTDEGMLKIADTHFLHQVVKIKQADWKLHYLIPVVILRQQVLTTWIKVGLFLLGLLAILLIFRVLKSRAELGVSRTESIKLRGLNRLLETEIVQRKKIEIELLAAHKDIKRSSKLAAMGQLSASIIHELSQPLSAMKTYIAGAQLPTKHNQADDNQLAVLPKLELLVVRMSRLAKQLRFFTRSNEKDIKPIDVKEVLADALIITMPLLEQAGVELICEQDDKPYIVLAGQVRLEQVLVNLINNALAAVENSPIKIITISLETNNTKQVIIKVKDTGEGLSDETLHMLFEPFYTTKPSGVGLGLGLAISTNIISEFKGSLIAINNADKGACFIVTLARYR